MTTIKRDNHYYPIRSSIFCHLSDDLTGNETASQSHMDVLFFLSPFVTMEERSLGTKSCLHSHKIAEEAVVC